MEKKEVITKFGGKPEKDDADIYKILDDIEKVEDCLPRTKGDPHTYKIYFNGHEVIELESGDILTPVEFKKKYYEITRTFAVFGKGEWCEFMERLGKAMERVENVGISEETVLVEDIVEKVRGLGEAESPEEALHEAEYGLMGENGTILYYNRHVLNMVERTKVPIERVEKLLRPYLDGPSMPKTIGKKSYRFWKFNMERIRYVGEDSKGL